MGICAKRSMKERGVSLMSGGVLAFKLFELQPYEFKTEIGLFFWQLVHRCQDNDQNFSLCDLSFMPPFLSRGLMRATLLWFHSVLSMPSSACS